MELNNKRQDKNDKLIVLLNDGAELHSVINAYGVHFYTIVKNGTEWGSTEKDLVGMLEWWHRVADVEGLYND